MPHRIGRLAVRMLPVLMLPALLSGCWILGGPQADFVATPLFDFPPLEVTFDASASSANGNPITGFVWDFGDGESDYGPVVTHTFWEKGVYDVTLTVTDASGMQGSVMHRVEALNRIPHAQFTFSPYMVGKGQPIRFDASESSDADGDVVAWYWDFGDGTVGEGEFVEHIYERAGSQGWKPQVTLTVVDDSGDENSTVRNVQVVGCDSCG